MDIKEVLQKYTISSIKNVSSPFYYFNSDTKIFKIFTKDSVYILKSKMVNEMEMNKEILLTLFFEKNKLLPKNYIIKTKNNKMGVKSHGHYFLLLRYLHGKTLFYKIIKNDLNNDDIEKMAVACSRLSLVLPSLKTSKLLVSDPYYLIKKLLEAPSVLSNKEKTLIEDKVSEHLFKYFLYKKNLYHEKGLVLDLNPLNIIISDYKAYFIDLEFVRNGNIVENIAQILLPIFIINRDINYQYFNNFLRNNVTIVRKNVLGLLLCCLKLETYKLYLWFNSFEGRRLMDLMKIQFPKMDFRHFKEIINIKEKEFETKINQTLKVGSSID